MIYIYRIWPMFVEAQLSAISHWVDQKYMPVLTSIDTWDTVYDWSKIDLVPVIQELGIDLTPVYKMAIAIYNDWPLWDWPDWWDVGDTFNFSI